MWVCCSDRIEIEEMFLFFCGHPAKAVKIYRGLGLRRTTYMGMATSLNPMFA